MTANDLISSSLRLLGVLQSGEDPSPEESNDGLVTLNQMLDEWSADRLLIPNVSRDGPFPLTPGQAIYYLGPQGGTYQLSITRPPKIISLGVVIPTNPLQPMELPLEKLTYDQWALVPVKNIPSAYPTKIYDDDGFPFRTLQVHPVPTAPCSIVVYDWNEVTQFPDLFTDLTFPPAYAKAIRYNLAIDLAPEYVEMVPPAVVAGAMESKAIIESMNAPVLDLRCDPMLTTNKDQLYNWVTDSFNRRS